jgi:type II secretion system protein C
MERMREGQAAVPDWRRLAPRWTAVVLAGLVAADLAHFILVLGAGAPLQHRAPERARAPRVSLDVQRLVGAHLFGVDRAGMFAGAPGAATPLPLALSGVIATSDPNDGYAILGEQGKATRLYRTGTAFADAAGSLYQVFPDHVVLALSGRLETLTLPELSLNPTRNGPRGVRRMAQVETVAHVETPAEAAAAIAAALPSNRDPPTAAEGWFSRLYAERYKVDGKLEGMVLHPAKPLQRRYGLRDGDTLTQINGISVTDADALDNALKTSGQTLALTLVRNGVQETLSVPVNE